MTKCPACKTSVANAALVCPSCGARIDAASLPTAVLPPSKQREATRLDDRLNQCVPDSADGARFATGTRLTERYRIVSLVGRGGMGEVYKAEDLKLKQIVALKFLPEAIALDEGALARFHNEVRITRQISHPNVCRVYDIGEVDGRNFLSMEFIDGEDLSSLLRRIGRLPGDKAVEIARQICAGLAAAHDNGVLHRDLKPANVMIDGRGKARITDFGVAVVAAELSGDEAIAGTPGYMAPEQLSGQEVTQRSDIYSLGLVLYELFTGKPVFESKSIHDLIKLHQTSAPTNPSNHVKNIDPLVEKVILRCLEKDPGKRPSSAIQVAAALPGGDPLAAALAAGETPSPEMVAAAKTEEGLRPAVAIVLAAGALVMLAAVVLMSDAIGLHYKIPFEKSPEVLQARAAEIVKQLGYADEPIDYATGFSQDQRYLDYLRENDLSPRRWDKLASGQPALITFWYRQSPVYLWPFGQASNVTPNDPPPTGPGMTYVALDTRGRLINFSRVPPQLNTPAMPADTPDWALLFNAAGLDISRFTPSEAQWNPPNYSDARATWQGVYPDQPQLPLRIEAASYHGKPTYFALIGPWTGPARETQRSQSMSERVSIAAAVLLLLSILVGAVLLARYNLKLGRGDRKGALRLALFILVLGGVDWLTRGHVPMIRAELETLFYELSNYLLLAGMIWLTYIALEPFMRRRWPNLIISWNRLLAGNYRDPLIGREILIGGVCGASIWVLGFTPQLISKWLGKPYDINHFTPPLRGMRSLINLFAGDLASALGISMGGLLLGLVFSFVLRKRWLAGILIWLLVTASIGLQTPSFVSVVCAAIGIALAVMVTMRYGLLTAYFCFLFLNVISNNPTTTNLSAWYAGSTIFALTICTGLILYGFYTSLAGQRLFRGQLLDE
ncbi:MAG TPA: protein kinase [Pyrinomonadaceae bacterium]|nr:protein kinase [Pyrinomonadaceae bacterium]